MNRKEIKDWLDLNEITNYKIKANLVVDVAGDVDLRKRKLISIPIKFGEVKGSFNCSQNELISLKGSPKKVLIHFICGHNHLDSLEHSPEYVGAHFSCESNKITSMRGASPYIGGNFHCTHNQIKNCIGAPLKVKGMIFCSRNELENFDGLNEYEGITTTSTILKKQDYFKELFFQGSAHFTKAEIELILKTKQLSDKLENKPEIQKKLKL